MLYCNVWLALRDAALIFFLTTSKYQFTHLAVLEAATTVIRVKSYAEILTRTRLPVATYIFTDIDRMSIDVQHQATQIFQLLLDQGCTVLNNPARIPSRYGLLRQLHARELNQFNAYRVEDNPVPRRWPVFLREDKGHDGVASDLLYKPSEVRAAIRTALKKGRPLSNLILVEYAAEKLTADLFRKLSVFRLGNQWIGHTCVHSRSWQTKVGETGIASTELYDDEFRIVRDNPYLEGTRPAFEISRIDYGRADFGFVGGKIQVYEINTNPVVKFGKEHPFPRRMQSYELFRENYLRSLAALDTPASDRFVTVPESPWNRKVRRAPGTGTGGTAP